jgi:hypothetical protein
MEFLSDPATLRNMGRDAAKHVRMELAFSDQLERTLNLYRQMTAKS